MALPTSQLYLWWWQCGNGWTTPPPTTTPKEGEKNILGLLVPIYRDHLDKSKEWSTLIMLLRFQCLLFNKHNMSCYKYSSLMHNFKSSHSSTLIHWCSELSRAYELRNEKGLEKSQHEIRMPVAAKWWCLAWSVVAESSVTDHRCRWRRRPACWHCRCLAAGSLLATSAWYSRPHPAWPWHACGPPSADSCWGGKGRRVRGRSRSRGQWQWQLRQFCLD